MTFYGEIMELDLPNKQCYKLEEKLIENINILHNKFNNFVIFWNRYQIILYEGINFGKATKTIIPEYPIQCLLLSNNYLVSLDCSYNVHLFSLKLKKVSQKCFRSTFHPRDTGVKAIAQISADKTISLKMENNLYCLNINRLNQDFYLEKRAILLCKEHFPIQTADGICLMSCHTIKLDLLKKLQGVFNIDINSRSDYSLIVISFDRKGLYACLFNASTDAEEVPLIKLYSCPTEICNIEVIDTDDLQMFIGLTIGTIIKLSLIEKSKNPDIIHLNTALSKFVLYSGNLIYTDSETMWIAENVHSELILKQLFIRNVKDFIIMDDLIICTTFLKLIYKFPIQSENTYLKLESEEYCPVENILNNSEHLQRVMEHVEKSEQLVKKLGEEETYLTALALSNRKNLLDDIIKSEVNIYDSYLNVMKENLDFLLIEDISNYCAKDTILFLINVTFCTVQHKLNKILKNIFDNSRILITLSSENKTLKSVSIQMTRQNYDFKCLIPLEGTGLAKIHVNITIATNIPGIFDNKTNIMSVLYSKDFD